MTDSTDYLKLKTHLLDAIDTSLAHGKLTSDELDTIFRNSGFETISSGTIGRGDWINERITHRTAVNRLIREDRNATLEFIGRDHNNQTVYGLVSIAKTMVGKPMREADRWYRRMETYANHMARDLAQHFAPPPGLNEEDIKRYYALIKRSAANVVRDFLDRCELHLINSGWREHMPTLSAKIVKIREGDERPKPRNKRRPANDRVKRKREA
jgi:hypothetical protein